MGKERLGTVGDRGTKQVKGRQLTRPFLVRDAPYPHRVASAPSTPPPRANGQAPAPPRPTRILARPPRQLHPGETKRSEVVHNRESHVEHLGPSNPLENAAICLIHPLLTSTWPLSSDGNDASQAPAAGRGMPRFGDVAHEEGGAVWPYRFWARRPAGPRPTPPCLALPRPAPPASPCPALPRPAPPCLPPPLPASPCLTQRQSNSAEGSS